MEGKNSFTIVNDKGETVVCDVLFTFDSEETGKSYVAYTDNTKDSNGNVQVYASTYDPKEANPRLNPIESDKEWKVVETILSTLQDEVRKKMTGKTEDVTE